MRLWRLEFLTYWLQAPKPDLGQWYWFDLLMETAIIYEVTLAAVVIGFLWTHGGL